MNPRNTWYLIILAAGLFAFIFFFERHQKPEQATAVKVLPHLEAAEVTAIQIQPAGQLEIRADRIDGVWKLTKPIDYAAQGEWIETFLRILENLTSQTHISAKELHQQAGADEQFGFEAPQVTILLQQGKERFQLKVGFFTAPGDQVYLQLVGSEGIEVVRSEWCKLIPRNVNDWRDTTFVSFQKLAFDQIAVTNANGFFQLQHDTNRLWRIRPMSVRADGLKVEELLTKLEGLRVGRFVTDDAKADLESFGLQPPELELNFSRGTNSLFAVQFGKPATNNEHQIYAKIKGQPSVVQVSGDVTAPWRSRYEDFRDRRLAGLTSPALDLIEIHGQDKSADFVIKRQTNNTWMVGEPHNFQADAEVMRDFIDNLSTLEIVPAPGQFAVKDVVSESDFPKYGLADPARKYILKQNVGKRSSEATNVVAELDFGSTFEDKIYARRADRPEETSVYAVWLRDFQKLPSQPLQFRQRKIWNFDVKNVKGISVRQNGTTTQMLRKGENQWALAAGSQGIIESFAVEGGAEELGVLEAASWVERGDKNYAKYGFSDKPAQISVELNVKDKNQIYTLDIGGWSPNQLRYGATKIDGQTWIFEFSKTSWDRLVYDLRIAEKSLP